MDYTWHQTSCFKSVTHEFSMTWNISALNQGVDQPFKLCLTLKKNPSSMCDKESIERWKAQRRGGKWISASIKLIFSKPQALSGLWHCFKMRIFLTGAFYSPFVSSLYWCWLFSSSVQWFHHFVTQTALIPVCPTLSFSNLPCFCFMPFSFPPPAVSEFHLSSQKAFTGGLIQSSIWVSNNFVFSILLTNHTKNTTKVEFSALKRE